MSRQFLPAAAAVFLLTAGSASATVITDGQLIRSFDAGAANGGWSDVIGNANVFQTTSITVNTVGADLELVFESEFADDIATGFTLSSQTVNVADVFIRTTGQSGWNHYGIALGKQGLPIGFYAVDSHQTSLDIWTSRPGFNYGGNWDTCDNGGDPCVDGAQSPVRITGGQFLSNAALTVIDSNTFKVVVSNWSLSQFDLFWGTADCSNDAIYGAADVEVSEPATLALLGAGLFGLAAFRRRKAA
jgi:hypothetical protein